MRSDALVAAGQHRAAAQLLTKAAASGDADALFELAHWRIYGNIIRRDLALARSLLAQAGSAGHRQAALLHCGFLANGIGGQHEWGTALSDLEQLAQSVPEADAQLRLLTSMQLDENGDPTIKPGREPLSEAPLVFSSRGLLSKAECKWLIDTAQPRLVRSTVLDPASGSMIPHPFRTCDYSIFGVLQEDMIVGAIYRRIAALTGTASRQGEALQLLSYGTGGEYRSHVDALAPTDNQRVITALIYLNEDYRGGSTLFSQTGLSFRGATGDALVFRNVRADGRPDRLSQHAGLPVTSGTKYLASRWIRERPLTFPAPQPILAD
ncbi:2OG-Fe(II) oxygenase [Roseibium sp.]|uniref:2OG-Fe(II) oxygenase n=1 Tax=Roseibium sp. TaxID=1936156 RepID=UPI003297AD0A